MRCGKLGAFYLDVLTLLKWAYFYLGKDVAGRITIASYFSGS